MMMTTTSTSTSTTTATATEFAQNIGIVGLGRMGTAIAKNILKSGFKVVVYSKSSIEDTVLFHHRSTFGCSSFYCRYHLPNSKLKPNTI